MHMLPDLLHSEERKVWGDGGYQGQSEAITKAAPNAQDMTCRRTKFNNYVGEVARRKNTTKSRVRAKVEHVFRILKRVFGFDKVRYRGLAKNHHRLCANFALVNLYLHRKQWVTLGQECVWRPENGLHKPQINPHTPSSKKILPVNHRENAETSWHCEIGDLLRASLAQLSRQDNTNN
jgi:hypothetical protein